MSTSPHTRPYVPTPDEVLAGIRGARQSSMQVAYTPDFNRILDEVVDQLYANYKQKNNEVRFTLQRRYSPALVDKLIRALPERGWSAAHEDKTKQAQTMLVIRAA